MKFTTSRPMLAEVAAWVSQATPKGTPTAPILAGLCIVADQDGVRLSSMDYETSHTAHIPVDVEEPGTAIVSAKFAVTLFAELAGKDVALSTEDNGLHIKSGRSAYRSQMFPEADYPTLPEMPAGVIGLVEHDHLSEALGIVKHAVARDATVPVLQGVHAAIHDGTLWLEATNRHRLAHASLPLKGDATELDVTIPLMPLQNALKGLRGTLTFAQSEGLLGFADDQRAVTIRKVSEPYPNVHQFFDLKSGASSLEVDRDELAAAIKRSLIAVDENASVDLINVDIEPGHIALASAGSAFEGSEVIECDTTAGPISVDFNGSYLADALAASTSDRVRFQFVPPKGENPRLSQFFIQPVGDDTCGFIVMPRRRQ